MHLEKLYLANFKNYEEVNIRFSPSINVLAGENGSGKTNLLEAIHFLSATKSAFGASEQQCIRHEQGFYSIIGEFYIGG
ncbi:MAG: AAA family ATPase [Cyclobacteriaceae bacterium]|nr:AAA family ATPase [Cyclobacteriaceae bacterium]